MDQEQKTPNFYGGRNVLQPKQPSWESQSKPEPDTPDKNTQGQILEVQKDLQKNSAQPVLGATGVGHPGDQGLSWERTREHPTLAFGTSSKENFCQGSCQL